MTQDLYSELLGLPEGKRPPDHYAILGLEPFETGREKIHKVVLEQTARLRVYALDPNPERARAVQDMLNEVNRAGTVLETPKQKWAYDVALAEERLALPPCPACGRRLAPETVICTQCGLHLGTGVKLVTVEGEAAAEAPGAPAAPPAPARGAGFGLTLEGAARGGLEQEEVGALQAPAAPGATATPLPSMDMGRAFEEALKEDQGTEAERVETAVAAEAQPPLVAPPVVGARKRFLRREVLKGVVFVALLGTGIGIWTAQWGRVVMLWHRLKGQDVLEETEGRRATSEPKDADERRQAEQRAREEALKGQEEGKRERERRLAVESALADKLVATGSDEECLKALSGSPEGDVLAALDKLAFAASSPEGGLRAKELLYMAYGLSPNDMRRGKLLGAGLGSPSDEDTKELERWAKALASGKPPPPPPPAWAGEALRALAGVRQLGVRASDAVGGLVAVAGALRACREIAAAAQGGTGAFQDLRFVLESGDPRRELVRRVQLAEMRMRRMMPDAAMKRARVAEDKDGNDADALAAVIAEDLKELAKLWKEPPPPWATPTAETPRPWTILAQGGALPGAAPASRYAQGTYSANSVSRLTPGSEGQRVLQGLSEALQALDGRLRSLPNVPESATKAAQQVLAEAALGEELADTPLQAACYKLNGLGRMLVICAQAQRPDDEPAARRLEEESGHRDAEARSLFEQVAAQARFVVEAQLLMAGVKSTGGSSP